MADPDDGFLARWSRRKVATRPGGTGQDLEPERRESIAPTATPEGPSAPAAGDKPPAEAAESEVVAQLPDIDSLDDSSDFSVFLREGVPDAIRRKALRKLWRINPVLANLDGLNDYDEDFTDAAMVVETLKTAYRVGKGYLDEDAETEGEAAEASVVQGPGESAQAGEGGLGQGDAPAADGGPERDPPRIADSGEPVPESDSDAGAGAGEDAAEGAPRSDDAPRRSARDKRWGGFTS